MGDGGVDLQGLQGLFPLLLLRLELHGPDVVDPVADLDEDHPDVLGHGHEHLPQVLHLLLCLGGVLHPGQLGDPLHQVGHGVAEAVGHLLMGGLGVLDGVVKEGGHDGVGVQAQLRHQVGHLQGVGDIGGAVLAELALVIGPPVLEGLPDPGPVLLREGGKLLLQLCEPPVYHGVHLLHGESGSLLLHIQALFHVDSSFLSAFLKTLRPWPAARPGRWPSAFS